jgi:hypothetical protein
MNPIALLGIWSKCIHMKAMALGSDMNNISPNTYIPISNIELQNIFDCISYYDNIIMRESSTYDNNFSFDSQIK